MPENAGLKNLRKNISVPMQKDGAADKKALDYVKLHIVRKKRTGFLSRTCRFM